MKLTKMLLLIAFVALFGCGSLFGQTLNGPAIPDSTAQRLYFLNLSNLDSPTRQAHLANNTGLSATDITTATMAISNFKTSYDQAVTQYNTAVTSASGFSQGALSTFQSQQADTTAIAMGYVQSRLSPAGYTALQTEITSTKSTIKAASTGSTMVMGTTSSSMGCCYNTITSQTITVLSWSPRRATLTFTTTLEGNVPTFTYPGVVHQGTIYSHVGNEVGSVTGSWAAPNVYINLTTNVILDTNYDTCLVDGYCTEVTTAAVHCSAINGGNQFTSSSFAQVEVAVTEGYWGGSPPPACSVTYAFTR
jgi:hypothetical protein